MNNIKADQILAVAQKTPELMFQLIFISKKSFVHKIIIKLYELALD